MLSGVTFTLPVVGHKSVSIMLPADQSPTSR